MLDKPKMYKGNVRKEFNNNRSIYASYSDNENRNINFTNYKIRFKRITLMSSQS